MTAKPTWTNEEQFWRDIRRALLELVNAIEVGKLSERVDVPTSKIRGHLKSYRRAYAFPPTSAEGVRERIAPLAAEHIVVLTTKAECDKL